MELAVAVMGEHYGVDAFDQPGVEAGKIAAYALMGAEGVREAESGDRGVGAEGFAGRVGMGPGSRVDRRARRRPHAARPSRRRPPTCRPRR
jgi:hypothetical protein